LGMLWYSPALFGTLWAKEHNFNLADLKATPLHYLGAILVSLIIVSVFYILIHSFSVNTVAKGAVLGFFLWLGFIATTHFSGVLWARKPLKAYLIDTSFQLVSLIMIGAILAAWW
jgi:hypothetical protein